MSPSARSSGRTVWTAVRVVAIFTILLGVAYPLVVTGVGQLLFPHQANGSVVRTPDGTAVGSALVGQSFSDADGNPLREYFQPRPSVAGDGYDATASAGSNQGPQSDALVAAIEERTAQIAAFNGVPGTAVPADAVTASGSGLDPNISPAYARIQVERVAAARGLSAERLRMLVDEHTRARDLGFIGEPRVNVVELNLALDERA